MESKYPDPVIPLIRQAARAAANKSEEEVFNAIVETFCKDCPFPLKDPDGVFPLRAADAGDLPFPLRYVLEGPKATTWHFESDLFAEADAQPVSTKRLGKGTYRASQIGSTISITANGVLPGSNTGVRIEQLAYLIYPPMFGLFFYEPRLQSVDGQDFPCATTFSIGSRLKTVTVHDADGFHKIEVE